MQKKFGFKDFVILLLYYFRQFFTPIMKCGTYFCFFDIGFVAYMHYYCVVAQTNYFAEFYDASFITLYNLVAGICDLLGSIIIIPLENKVAESTIFKIFVTCNMIAFVIIVPMQLIKNFYVKQFFTLIPALFASTTAAMYDSLAIAISTRIEEIYCQAVMLGNGAGNAFVQIMEDIIEIFFPQETDNIDQYHKNLTINAIVYYSMSVILLLQNIITWVYLSKREPLFTYNEQSLLSRKKKKSLQDQKISLLEVADEHEETTKQDTSMAFTKITEQNKNNKVLDPEQTDHNHLNNEGNNEGHSHMSKELKKKIHKLILPVSIAQWQMFFVWYIIFPMCLVIIPSSEALAIGEVKDDWWTLTMLTVYLVATFLGFLLPLWSKIAKACSLKVTMIICYIRIIFLLFYALMCFPIAKTFEGTIIQKPIINNDYIAIIVTFLFGCSASFVYTMGEIKFQDLFDDIEQREYASFILNLWMQIGLMCGSLIQEALTFFVDDLKE